MKKWEYLMVDRGASLRLLDPPEGRVMNEKDPDSWVWDQKAGFQLGDGQSVVYHRPNSEGLFVPADGNPDGFTKEVDSVFNHLGFLGWELVATSVSQTRLLMDAATGDVSRSTISHVIADSSTFKRPLE